MERIGVIENRTGDDFEANLQQLIADVAAIDADFVLAPEVCLTGFCYGRMKEADTFGKEALASLQRSIGGKTLALTLIEERDGAFYNVAKVIQKGRVIHEQAKHKLFLLGDEHRHFASGDEEDIRIFEVDGIKVAMLICFELRFPALWQRVEGAEIILVPAMWGRNRAFHYKSLNTALAIANRAYVAAADSANDDMAKESAVITPWGERTGVDARGFAAVDFNPREIVRMKRAIPYE